MSPSRKLAIAAKLIKMHLPPKVIKRLIEKYEKEKTHRT